MKKYRIKIESSHPEFDVDSRLKDGFDVEGFLLIGFNDEAPSVSALSDLSINNLAAVLATDKEDDRVLPILLQAFAISQGMRKALRIKKEYAERRHMAALKQLLIGDDDEDEEEEEDD